MRIIWLQNVRISGTEFEKLPVIIDAASNVNVLLLPLLWSIHLSNFGTSHRILSQANQTKLVEILEEFEIHDKTIISYFSKVYSFLKWLPSPIDNNLAVISDSQVNDYLNSVLPERRVSLSTLTTNLSAISSFFNFLYSLGICQKLRLNIYRKTRNRIESNYQHLPKLKYISKSIRSKLLMSTLNKRDRLIFRMGSEVGLRAAENLGLVLEDVVVGNKTIKGLRFLFEELASNKSKLSFEFYLRGIYAKRSKGRFIYFSRPLLEDIKNYFDTERLENNKRTSDYLFIRSDHDHVGKPISAEHATRMFRKLLNTNLPNLRGQFSYHDLRHTFATELYHSELLDEDGLETRSESAALFAVSVRLGHRSTDTTKEYIRLSHQMRLIEDNESLKNLG